MYIFPLKCSGDLLRFTCSPAFVEGNRCADPGGPAAPRPLGYLEAAGGLLPPYKVGTFPRLAGPKESVIQIICVVNI